MEILHTVNSGGEFGAFVFGCIVAALAIFLIIGAVSCIKEKEFEFGILFGTVSIIASLASFALFNDYATPDPAKYEVLITDMSAFDTEKYEIIEQRGKVFVIQEVAK